MIREFTLSHGLFARYARLLCDTVIPFQELDLRDRQEGVPPSHAVKNFENAAYLLKNG